MYDGRVSVYHSVVTLEFPLDIGMMYTIYV